MVRFLTKEPLWLLCDAQGTDAGLKDGKPARRLAVEEGWWSQWQSERRWPSKWNTAVRLGVCFGGAAVHISRWIGVSGVEKREG